MKSFTKRLGALAVAFAIAVSLIVGSCLMFGRSLFTASAADNSYKYFYNQIASNSMAEKFYQAYETLVANGEFKKGKIQYDLIANGIVSKDDAAKAVNGADNNKMYRAYAMARDAFYMDHPDLFYADVFSTSISVGQKGADAVAYLDSSRVLTTYRGNLNTEALVNDAIQAYESELSQIVSNAQNAGGVKEQIEYVNKYIAEHSVYGFGTKLEGDRNVDTPKAAFIYTSYGALVNRESVCEGYAKSFKAVMDRLGIPCVCVQGYADGDGGENYQPHMWNYVEVEGMWYAVDVTYNSTEQDKGKWTLLGEQSLFNTHIEDGVVSTSDYELNYPALKPYDYGVDTDENGMSVISYYTDTGEHGKILNLIVSYEEKGAEKLEEDGKYLVYSYSYLNSNNEMVWTPWTNAVAVNYAIQMISEDPDYEFFTVTDHDTTLPFGTGIEFVRFALLNRAPDSVGDYLTGEYLVAYNPDALTEADFLIDPTVPYRNNGFMSYLPSPGAVSASPSNTGDLPVNKTYDITIEYNVRLEFEEGYSEENIELDFVSSRGNNTVKNHAVVKNFKWDGDRTISFTFTPSRMYIHNAASYYFTPVGLVGADSKKAPDPVRYSFAGKNVVCSKVFNDGRLYMNVFGDPLLLDDSDLSVTDFKDKNDKYYAESQRSQLLLVASKPSSAQEQEMNGVLKNETGIQDNEIVASSTYEIDLQICGSVQKIPNGAYMQVAFGFPEGYEPDDKETTFKIYHYKHDNQGNITGVEEIPVIITEYGLIAKVTSFSPFTIVQIKNSSAAVQNNDKVNIYACVNGGVGGTICADGKSGIAEVTDSITYDITPEDGYTVGCVRLNGKVLDASLYQSGKLTLAKNDIESSNTLEVVFVTEESANYYAAQGVSLSYGAESDFAPSAGSNVVGIVVGCIVAVLALAAGGFAVWWFFVKKKQPATANASAQAKGAKQTKSTGTKKTSGTVSKQTKSASRSKTSASKGKKK